MSIVGIIGSCAQQASAGGGGSYSYDNQYAVDLEADSGQYIKAGNNTDLDYTTNSFSYSFWMKPETSGPSNEWVIDKTGPFGTWAGYQIIRNSNNQLVVLFSNGGSTKLEKTTTGTAFGSGSWIHVCVVFTAGSGSGSGVKASMAVYRNGSAVSLNAGTENLYGESITSATPFAIGTRVASHPGWSQYYDGIIDEFSFWGKALSSAEVTEIYNGGVPGNLTTHSATSDLTNWYRMGDDSSDDLTGTSGQITDVIGSANLTPFNTSSSNKVALGPTAGILLNHWYKFPSPGESSFPPSGANTIIDVGTSTATRDNIDAINIAGQSSGRTLGSDTFNTYDFNGTNANATSVVGYNSTLFPADDFSFTAWVKWDTVANFEMIFMAGDVGAQDFSEGYYLYPILTSPGSEANGYAPGTATPDNVLVFSSGGYNASIGGSLVYASIPSTGTWFHVACTIDVSGNAQAIYVNGTAGTGPGVTVQAPTSTNENRFLSIGAYQINGGSQYYKFDGEMSDVRFYSKALSSAEVAAIYAGDFSP